MTGYGCSRKGTRIFLDLVPRENKPRYSAYIGVTGSHHRRLSAVEPGPRDAQRDHPNND